MRFGIRPLEEKPCYLFYDCDPNPPEATPIPVNSYGRRGCLPDSTRGNQPTDK